MKSFNVSEIFTPCSPASYTYVERESINKQLIRAFNTPGKQIIIYGHSGVGKSTILTNKLKDLKISTITTRCIKDMSLYNIIVDAFNQLDIYYKGSKESADNGEIGGGISASYFGIKAELKAKSGESESQNYRRAVELPITPQTLAKYFGEAGVCWIIEDFHKIEKRDKVSMSQIMKVFMDNASVYPKLKIIAVGAVSSAREVVQYDPEMGNRISEVFVPLMSDTKLSEIIQKGSDLLNIRFEDSTIGKIVKYSSGLPSITHQLCLLLCEIEEIQKTVISKFPQQISNVSFNLAVDEYIKENSDTMKSTYDLATIEKRNRKNENPKDILNAILFYSKHEGITIKEIEKVLKKQHTEYKATNLRKYVDELTTSDRGEILRHEKESDSYSFSTPFIKAYTFCMKDNNRAIREINKTDLFEDIHDILKKELKIARLAFEDDFSSDGYIFEDLGTPLS
jgi:hypothetical protein